MGRKYQLKQRAAALNPQPDPTPWREIRAPEARLRRSLAGIYASFERAGDMLACVLRDAEVHEPTREVVRMRRGGPSAATREALAAGPRGTRASASLELALDFGTWRRLTASGLSRAGLSRRW